MVVGFTHADRLVRVQRPPFHITAAGHIVAGDIAVVIVAIIAVEDITGSTGYLQAIYQSVCYWASPEHSGEDGYVDDEQEPMLWFV